MDQLQVSNEADHGQKKRWWLTQRQGFSGLGMEGELMIKKEKLIGNLATQLPPRARLKKKLCCLGSFQKRFDRKHLFQRQQIFMSIDSVLARHREYSSGQDSACPQGAYNATHMGLKNNLKTENQDQGEGEDKCQVKVNTGARIELQV